MYANHTLAVSLGLPSAESFGRSIQTQALEQINIIGLACLGIVLTALLIRSLNGSTR